MIEEWKEIKEYEGYYQVSTLGNVKSLDREIIYKDKHHQRLKGRILKMHIDCHGYKKVNLSKNNKNKVFKVHKLVMETFDEKQNLHIDHINEIKTDNRFCNLQYLTQRDNLIKTFLTKKQKTSSKYIGVSFNKQRRLWRSQITINKKNIHIGYFKKESEAAKAHQDVLKNGKSAIKKYRKTKND